MPGIVRKTVKCLKRQKIKLKTLTHQQNTFGLSKGKLLKAALHGFTADEYVVYDLDHNDRREYVPEYERLVFRERMVEQRVMMDNKLVFYHLIKSFAPVNTIFAFQKNGRYISLEQGWDKELVPDNLSRIGRMVRKKMNVGGGDGFILLEYRDNQYFRNREICTKEDILRLLDHDDYFIEEYCEQSGFENRIWPYSVNTIRIVTIMNGEKPARAVMAIHRFGIEPHKCVDNVSAGGAYANIDLETGCMSAAVCRAPKFIFDENRRIKEYRCHPVSGADIQNAIVPCWKSIVKATESLHETLAFTGVGFIAWDIALTEGGYKVIEGNTSSTMKLIQTFNGARHTEIGAWMRRYR